MPTDPNQTTLAEIVRTVRTRDGNFTIRFPLPPARSEVRAPMGVHWKVLLRDMNRWLNAGHPVVCPLTGQLVRIYRRCLHRSQVTTLRRLRQAMIDTGAPFVHLRQFSGRRDGDLAKLAHWGLAETRRGESGASDRGFWRITDQGRLWLFGDIKIPRQMAILLGECLGAVDERDLIGPADVDDEFDLAKTLGGSSAAHEVHA